MSIEEIHNSLVNGLRRQMVTMIDKYGNEFWSEYKVFLSELYSVDSQYQYFTDATISYFRYNFLFPH